MCGIAGIVALRGAAPTRTDVERMCDAITHRGPDDAGYLVEGQVALGMRRLSIIDLAGGHQPIFNEDGTVGVVYNGEIYNYRELRDWLKSLGHSFRTASDTEVIVHLWEQVGIDFAKHLNGMFAIALYDRARQRVVLARDHVGIKPLYYSLGADALVFGSEVKAVLESGRVPRRLKVDGLAQFLSWEYVPGAGTMLQDVHRLEPARTLELDLATGRSTVRRFWSPLATEGTDARSDGGRVGRRGRCRDTPLGAKPARERRATRGLSLGRRGQLAGRGGDGRRRDLQHRIRRPELQRDAVVEARRRPSGRSSSRRNHPSAGAGALRAPDAFHG